MAPEIFKRNYAGPEVDLFACGVVLFFMMTKNPPFSIAQPTDYFYKEFYPTLPNTNIEKFWTKHLQEIQNPYDGKSKLIAFASPQFKSLINLMLDPNPEKRLKLEEIKSHEWYNGPICNMMQICNELTEVRILIESQIKKDKARKKRVKALTQLYMEKKKNLYSYQSLNELKLYDTPLKTKQTVTHEYLF